MRLDRWIALFVLLAASGSLAGEKLVQNDRFTGMGAVNTQQWFAEYDGAGVMLTADQADYPLTLVAVDIFAAPTTSGGSGNLGAYVLDVWDNTVALPPTTQNGNRYSSGVQLTALTDKFNRFPFPSPITITSGPFFVAVRQQTSSSFDGTTIATDPGPVVQGANYYWRFGWIEMTGPDAGVDAGMWPAISGIDRNWIIRGVISAPDVPPTVTDISPQSGDVNQAVALTVTGTDFTISSRVFLGSTELTVTSRVPPTTLFATVPGGFAPGIYDVTVENPGPLTGTLPQAYTAFLADGGTGVPDAGTPGKDGGTGGAPDAGGGDEDAGAVDPEALTLESIDPTDIFSEDETTLVLLGTNFHPDVQVLVGTKLMDETDRKSASVIEAVLQPGTDPGVYDVTVINPDGTRASLKEALTVHDGTSVATGCSCGSAPAAFSLGMLVLLAAFRLRRRSS